MRSYKVHVLYHSQCNLILKWQDRERRSKLSRFRYVMSAAGNMMVLQITNTLALHAVNQNLFDQNTVFSKTLYGERYTDEYQDVFKSIEHTGYGFIG